jgi:hypothetical protein
MRVSSIFRLFPWFGVVWSCAAVAAPGEEISFNREIRPILSDRCFACHGPDEETRKSDLRLDTFEGATEGGELAIPIVPGKPGKSELVARINETDPDEIMPPPKSHKTLTAAEKKLLERWILEGARYEKFWAFVPPARPEKPVLGRSDWSPQAIDLHVLQRLEEMGMTPNGEADKCTLIRRATFDLTGLPPTPEEVRAFLADESPGAYESLVDRLLARPQYGEHMARYWLDLVRFADTNGMHKDFYRNFYTFRNWVIRAFNENLGYDDFVRYQLAGDLFPEPSNDQLVASGFNRLHLIIDIGTALPEESFFKNVVDRTTAVGTAFMGLTVHCAMCHDHKYDPLTQRDFYSLYAFFNNIDAKPETTRAPKNGLQPPFVSLATPAQQSELGELEAQLARQTKEIETAKKSAEGELDPEKKKQLLALVKDRETEKNALAGEKTRLQQAMPHAMVMRERKEIRPAHIMKRGQYDDPGEPVTRDTPDFLPSLKMAGETATRMDLAEWFVDPENPLTSRVAVNRFWQQFFGVGLVKTSEDLGAQGEVPSHPELLDYLAVSFIESGWDIKKLVREIVTSKTYRQSSVAAPEHHAEDPENRLLARGSRYRMDAEMIRDQILATSGLLSPTVDGPSVKPPQPDGLWQAVTMTGERFRPDRGEDIYRRSVYTYWKRAMPPPQMTILNAPIRDACTARRERTNTPSQALLLLNENEYFKAARALAHEALSISDATQEQRLDHVYETVTSRLPDEKERATLSGLLADLKAAYVETPALANELTAGLDAASAGDKAELAAWTVVVNTLYNLDITKTRE